MSENDVYIDLEPGDFVYQADQELFLVVTAETDNGYRFAVHGWREISHSRLDEYIGGKHGKLHKQEDIEQIIEEEADDSTKQNFDRLRELFESYNPQNIDQEVAEDFAMEDT